MHKMQFFFCFAFSHLCEKAQLVAVFTRVLVVTRKIKSTHFLRKKFNFVCVLWWQIFSVLGKFPSGVLEQHWSRARTVSKNGWEEMAVLKRCGCRSEVLWAAYEQGPPSFKKACGRPIWPFRCCCIYHHCKVDAYSRVLLIYVSNRGGAPWRQRRRLVQQPRHYTAAAAQTLAAR